MGGEGIECPSHDLEDQGRQGGGFERVLQGAHLVENASKSPDVALLIVRLAFAKFRRDVVGRPYHGDGLAFGREDLADAEVSDLDVVSRFSQKDVHGF